MGSNNQTQVHEGALLNGARAGLAIVDKVSSPEQLRNALSRERAVSTLKLGARLLELRLITEDQLHGALQVQNTDARRHLGEILLDLGLISKGHLHQVLCEKLGIPLIDLARFNIDGAVLRLLPEDLVRESHILPLCRLDGKLVVAMSDPLDPEPIERARFFVQAPVIPVMATSDEIELAIRSYYGRDRTGREAQASTRLQRPEARRAEFESSPAAESDSSVSNLVNTMIADACAAGASDIHVDGSSGSEYVAVRFRRDGELVAYMRFPGNLRAAIVTRVKAMAGIDISERRHAHEGRVDAIENGPAGLRLRVITVPTRDGNEDIAIKLLPSRESLPLQMLGLADAALDDIKELIARPYGLMLLAGPVGSGRTTTAYGLLSLLDVPGTKIWTAESPVEMARPLWSQAEVNDRIGWDYPAIMRAVVRADPDVILIGEMRDRESASLAVEASLRGSLVLSVVRGNGAAETVARVIDMGVDPFSLSDALLGVVAQRLARRLCLRCRISRPLEPSEIESLVEEYCARTELLPAQVRAEWAQRFGDEPLIFGAQGCELCGNTGYIGRIGFYEVLKVDPAMRRLMSQRRPFHELAAAAMQGGMRTLKQDGIEKALAGHCDMREVRTATV